MKLNFGSHIQRGTAFEPDPCNTDVLTDTGRFSQVIEADIPDFDLGCEIHPAVMPFILGVKGDIVLSGALGAIERIVRTLHQFDSTIGIDGVRGKPSADRDTNGLILMDNS